jgi:hypothetical protein
LKRIESESPQQEIENLVNLRHPRIICATGFVLPSHLQPQLWGFDIIGSYYWGDSVSENISMLPEWWTPKA